MQAQQRRSERAGPPLLRVAVFAAVGLVLRRLREPPGSRARKADVLPPSAEEQGNEPPGEEAPLCRFCFGDAREGELVAPCRCRGTQAHIHRACLREWQRSRLVAHGELETVCRVCGGKYELPWPPLRVALREWFSLRAGDRLHVWTCAWTQVLAASLLPLNEPRLASLGDVALLLSAAEARVFTSREMRRGRPGLRTMRNAALVSDLLHSSAVLCWLAALAAAFAGDALHACSRAAERAAVPALLFTPAAHALTHTSAALLVPVRAVVHFGEPLHRVVSFLERWPQYRL